MARGVLFVVVEGETGNSKQASTGVNSYVLC